ncbi:MAG: ImmA/IrrE family metallo-endopeptidase [Nitrospira sp. SB0678_bin_10]|nr:ImmA/IrrE family metallo-endopeptidase [Nitrospira sp. SB0678_bin_10]
MSINENRELIVRPESAEEVSKYARKTLRAADAIGRLPTPIDNLLAAAQIGNLKLDEEVKQSFAARLKGIARKEFYSMWQKIRGIADLRERVTYVDNNTTPQRIRFAMGHELGHEVLPWHRLDPGRFDDEKSLTWEAEEIFDTEANFFSAEVIFQGSNFTRIVRDYAVRFDSIFHLADMHGASRHSTAWRYVEEQDESVALVTYWPSKFNSGILRRGRVVPSPNFLRKFRFIDLPQQLAQDHVWATAHGSNLVHSDMISLGCDGGTFRFEWEGWWNGYSLFVMLRRKPKLRFVRALAEKVAVVSRM